jgi:hypothetical protein
MLRMQQQHLPTHTATHTTNNPDYRRRSPVRGLVHDVRTDINQSRGNPILDTVYRPPTRLGRLSPFTRKFQFVQRISGAGKEDL